MDGSSIAPVFGTELSGHWWYLERFDECSDFIPADEKLGFCSIESEVAAWGGVWPEKVGSTTALTRSSLNPSSERKAEISH
ncbi:hypothetical protein TWF694_010412 [Orbilia ellipsospora]|uniref:Uncharacterized protein n=1 Tax=Orbilia ellipsospora TaxID=2528407 RepID=A0AAV9XAQ5_9PEZI